MSNQGEKKVIFVTIFANRGAAKFTNPFVRVLSNL